MVQARSGALCRGIAVQIAVSTEASLLRLAQQVAHRCDEARGATMAGVDRPSLPAPLSACLLETWSPSDHARAQKLASFLRSSTAAAVPVPPDGLSGGATVCLDWGRVNSTWPGGGPAPATLAGQAVVELRLTVPESPGRRARLSARAGGRFALGQFQWLLRRDGSTACLAGTPWPGPPDRDADESVRTGPSGLPTEVAAGSTPSDLGSSGTGAGDTVASERGSGEADEPRPPTTPGGPSAVGDEGGADGWDDSDASTTSAQDHDDDDDDDDEETQSPARRPVGSVGGPSEAPDDEQLSEDEEGRRVTGEEGTGAEESPGSAASVGPAGAEGQDRWEEGDDTAEPRGGDGDGGWPADDAAEGGAEAGRRGAWGLPASDQASARGRRHSVHDALWKQLGDMLGAMGGHPHMVPLPHLMGGGDTHAHVLPLRGSPPLPPPPYPRLPPHVHRRVGWHRGGRRRRW